MKSFTKVESLFTTIQISCFKVQLLVFFFKYSPAMKQKESILGLYPLQRLSCSTQVGHQMLPVVQVNVSLGHSIQETQNILRVYGCHFALLSLCNDAQRDIDDIMPMPLYASFMAIRHQEKIQKRRGPALKVNSITTSENDTHMPNSGITSSTPTVPSSAPLWP